MAVGAMFRAPFLLPLRPQPRSVSMSYRWCSRRGGESYTAALSALDGLQSNAATLQQQQQRWRGGAGHDAVFSVRHTVQCLQLLGVGPRQLQGLAVVHVAGSKGKGSVCALTEALLRAHGWRTGFYSSPHLVTPRERLRLDGAVLSEAEFARYFWHVHGVLSRACEAERLERMPMYFMFLTVLGYFVFVQERVDVAVVEVGLGGRYDCTNVVAAPAVCAITCLDYDHTGVLGATIEQIAEQKAGIMKCGVEVFVGHQPLAARAGPVLARCAAATASPLYSVPPLSAYLLPPGRHSLRLSMAGQWQEHNAALALQLWRSWLRTRRVADQNIETEAGRETPAGPSKTEKRSEVSAADERSELPAAELLKLTERECSALEQCQWPGRCHTVRRSRVVYHLDGAHTPNSVRLALQWYLQVTGIEGRGVTHVLVVYLTGDRDAAALLEPLHALRHWQHVLFCHAAAAEPASGARRRFDECERLRRAWMTLERKSVPPSGQSPRLLSAVCVADAVNYIERAIVADSVRVFVVGSLHLVGGFLSLIDPELSEPGVYLQFSETPPDDRVGDGAESDQSSLVFASSDG